MNLGLSVQPKVQTGGSSHSRSASCSDRCSCQSQHLSGQISTSCDVSAYRPMGASHPLLDFSLYPLSKFVGSHERIGCQRRLQLRNGTCIRQSNVSSPTTPSK
jgi:hypothetical protein